MKFANIGLKAKMMIGPVFPMLLIIFLGVTGVMTLNYQSGIILSLDAMNGIEDAAAKMESAAAEMENAANTYLLTGDETAVERYEKASQSCCQNRQEEDKSI